MNYLKILKTFIVIYVVALATYFVMPAKAQEQITMFFGSHGPVYLIYTDSRPITLSTDYLYTSFGFLDKPISRLPQK